MALAPCRECGSPCSSSAATCPQCGAAVPVPPPPPPRKKPAVRPALLIGGALILAACIALIQQQAVDEAPAAPADATPQPTATRWLVRTSKGADGQDVHLATLLSANMIELERPKGLQPAQLVLQRRGTSKKTDIMVRMPRGVFACDQDGCPALVRIDQGADRAYTAYRPTEGDQDTVFIGQPDKLLAAIRAGKGFVIGLKLHNGGPTGFAFTPPGEPAWPR